ncbi:hypothetical protein [Ruania halotolerans]|uniref:hypothetical protein n=1 Tax=Ruania halotolerans TaxID=2897773 RepID=UPI001E40295F|nr:hypothetical protein [Ruania halotolerans]UFU06342.1 hypothetical protein LQF10_18260 [Ruania halotolerans]
MASDPEKQHEIPVPRSVSEEAVIQEGGQKPIWKSVLAFLGAAATGLIIYAVHPGAWWVGLALLVLAAVAVLIIGSRGRPLRRQRRG